MSITRRQFSKAVVSAATVATVGSAAQAASSDLLKRKIPSSGEEIPIVGLGTNRYGVGETAEIRAPLKQALKRFCELGGSVVDTAPSYRTSETVLGDLISELGLRDELFLATKTDKTGGREDNAEQIDASGTALKTTAFDLMQVHNLKGWQTALPLLRELKESGRVRYIGITTSRENQYGDFEKVMLANDLDFIQINYSLEQRQSAERLLPIAADRGMAVMINRAFGGGRLFQTVGERPLPQWAQEFDCTSWAQFLLKYALSHPSSTVAIPGMTKIRHVEDNMAAARGRLPDRAERRKMEALFDAL